MLEENKFTNNGRMHFIFGFIEFQFAPVLALFPRNKVVSKIHIHYGSYPTTICASLCRCASRRGNSLFGSAQSTLCARTTETTIVVHLHHHFWLDGIRLPLQLVVWKKVEEKLCDMIFIWK